MLRCLLATMLLFIVSLTPAEARKHHRHHHVVSHDRGAVIGGRPSGCPHAFCGCGASLYLFGKIIPDLNLAANWLRKFPRAMAAPRMVAARGHHVMVLVEHRRGNVWLVHDSNSGNHLTRLHERSIDGYHIVNPSA